jgi:hypothetical protein
MDQIVILRLQSLCSDTLKIELYTANYGNEMWNA